MKRFDTINIIPFIDIMLVLLAIVLTTATFVTQGQLNIHLPRASSAPPAGGAPIELAIDGNRATHFNGQPVPLQTLQARLSAVPKETAIVLRVDASVPFSDFVAVINVLAALQLERLSILTARGPA